MYHFIKIYVQARFKDPNNYADFFSFLRAFFDASAHFY
jgi:hypothetical protein